MEQKNNNQLTEQMLDELITASLHRQQVVEDIQQDVMQELHRSARRAWWRKWGRVVAFSFGLPLIFLVFGWLLYSFVSQQGDMPAYYLCLLIPVAVMAYIAYQALEKFSLERV